MGHGEGVGHGDITCSLQTVITGASQYPSPRGGEQRGGGGGGGGGG